MIKIAYPNLIVKVMRMSRPIIRNVVIPINTSDTSIKYDLIQERKAIGLDFMLVNNGTSTVSVKIDGIADTIDIQGGDSFSFSDIAFARIEITNSGGNTLVGMIAGVKVID